METTKKFDFTFSELQTIYNALQSDIKRDDETLNDLQIKRFDEMDETGEEIAKGIDEVELEAALDYNRKSKARVNNMIQTFDGIDIK